jgi:RNA polymerase sigma factor (sigma-70 family)
VAISEQQFDVEKVKEPLTVETMSDSALIDACLQGDEQAWQELLNRYYKLIYAVPLRFGFEQSVADEVFQEVCLILLEKLHTLRIASHFKAWLVTTTRRVCLQRLRSQRNNPATELTEQLLITQCSIEQQFLLTEQQQLLHQALSCLDERCQYLLWALFFEQPTPAYGELADQLAVPLGSIGPMRSRCLEKLRTVLLTFNT